MKIALLCLVLLLLPLPALAQSKKPTVTGKIKSRRALLETIKTKDREIRLWSDNTYDIVKIEPPEESTITLEVAVIKTNGEIVPGARTPVTIFNEDILPDLAKLPFNRSSSSEPDIHKLASRTTDILVMSELEKMDKTLLREVEASLASKTKLIQKTDLAGKTTITLPRSDKTQYLFTYYNLGSGIDVSTCAWYLKITPNKDQKLTLANDQAASCR